MTQAEGGEARPYRQAAIDQAIERYRATELTAVEDMIASTRLALDGLRRFRDAAADFRTDIGDSAAHAFAREELNDIIYDIQDQIAPLVRTYNSMLRDPGQSSGGPPE